MGNIKHKVTYNRTQCNDYVYYTVATYRLPENSIVASLYILHLSLTHTYTSSFADDETVYRYTSRVDFVDVNILLDLNCV